MNTTTNKENLMSEPVSQRIQHFLGAFVFASSFFSLAMMGSLTPAATALDSSEDWQGTYEVPMEDPSLQPFSSFPLSAKIISAPGEGQVLEYSIPVELDGVGQKIQFTRLPSTNASDLKVFTSPQGQLICQESQKSCNVRFKNLEINSVQMLKVIHSLSSSTKEFDARLRVARAFSGDPVGRIHLKYISFSFGDTDVH